MGTRLTTRQALIALAISMLALLVAFYIPLIIWGRQHDLLDWAFPAILIVSVFLLLPVIMILINILGQIIMIPFLGIFAIVERIKRKRQEQK